MPHRRQRGQAIVLVALILAILLGMAALAIDINNAMSERRALQGAADSAALAGARSAAQGTAATHWVAMQYLARELGFTLPVGSCASALICPAGTYATGAYSITLQDSGAALDVAVHRTQQSLFAEVLGIPTISEAAGGRATPQTPLTDAVGYALAAISGNAQVNGGGTSSPSGSVGGPVYVSGSFGTSNWPHTPQVPATQYGSDGMQCAGPVTNHVDLGGTTNGLNYQWTPTGTTGTQNTGVAPPPAVGSAPASSGPRYTNLSSAKDLLGRWKPGIYDGIYPSGGLLNPGVYQVVNVSQTISLGALTNLSLPLAGSVVDATGAVAIVLDGSDTGSLDVTDAVLNGIDYTSAQPTDAEGTHNFVVYGGAYMGSVTIGPHATTNLTGVVYLPQSPLTTNGSSSPVFTGSVVMASMTIQGGGNGTQTFGWVCGLQTVDASHHQGGLVR